MAGSRRGETAGCGLRGFTTWYEGVAEKATRRESPLISVSIQIRSNTAYNLFVFNTLGADLDVNSARKRLVGLSTPDIRAPSKATLC